MDARSDGIPLRGTRASDVPLVYVWFYNSTPSSIMPPMCLAKAQVSERRIKSCVAATF